MLLINSIRNTTVAIVLLALVGAAAGDEVSTSGLNYTDVKVTGVKDGRIHFRNKAGSNIRKRILKLKKISINEATNLNVAEILAGSDDFENATESYNEAIEAAAKSFVPTLAMYRRQQLLNRSGLTDKAVEAWLDMMTRDGVSKTAIALRPKKFADKGSERNSAAVGLLKTAMSKTRGPHRAAVLELLKELLSHEGKAQELLSMADKPQSDEAVVAGPKKSVAYSELLVADALLTDQKYAEASEVYGKLLRRVAKNRLPDVLMGLAKSQQGQSNQVKNTKAKRELMMKAGLNYMRIVTFFGNSKAGGISLYRAGCIMRDLPGKKNLRSARSAFRMVAERYKGTKIANDAGKALADLPKGR